jgi:hypothetical protein
VKQWFRLPKSRVLLGHKGTIQSGDVRGERSKEDVSKEVKKT